MDSGNFDENLRHLFDGDDSLNVYCKTVINLCAGAPGPDLLKKCMSMFSSATEHRMSFEQEDAFLFQYGITAGLWEFRDELSKFLTEHYHEEVKRADLVLTCGATNGLQIAMGTFLDPRAIIFVEDVTYMIALDAFLQYPLMKIVSVPMTNDGVNVEELEKIVAYEKSQWLHTSTRPFWGMFYSIPNFHNPTGRLTSVQKCKQIAKITRSLDVLVVCDDVYNLLYYGDGKPPSRLFTYNDEVNGNIVSNGTLSKILAPGIRVGWLEMPPHLTLMVRESGIMRSGGAVNHYVSGIITSILQLGLLKNHLHFLILTYKSRMNVLCDTLQSNLPDECTFLRPQGGYFVWIQLPTVIDGSEFTAWCKETHQVSAIHGARFDVNGGHKNYLRLSFAFHDEDTLKPAAAKLCSALNEYIIKVRG